MIVWGWQNRTKTLSSGSFYCPNEGGDRTYWIVQVRRWFTLFFIPVIPLAILGEYVQCSSCAATYDVRVLKNPTRAQIEDTMTSALRQIVVGLIRADGTVARSERDAAVEVMNRFSSAAYTHEDLERDLGTSEQEPDPAIRLAGLLNEHGKESVIRAALALATADGDVSKSELDAITTIGRDLGMSPAHLRGVLAEASLPQVTDSSDPAPQS